ncbi:Baseplate assembly protein J [Pseudomonas amygdali pv. eriobotryae]|uniref:Baseplate assembly protein J n=1 Tax=Pseudomonas amygdali pv. eriobotryae TaxID=129137 RepID=A0A3M3A8N9_PSEA0|nr:Baseplate assembly protein J [Pseudomonas amygdali pv. eriobotryae]
MLALEGSGEASADLLETVRLNLSDEDVRPLGDRLTVQSAEILPYRIKAVVHMVGSGPETEATLTECKSRLQAWINPRRRLGLEVARSGLDAQLHISGVSRVDLQGWIDIRPTKSQAAWCEAFTVSRGS